MDWYYENTSRILYAPLINNRSKGIIFEVYEIPYYTTAVFLDFFECL